MSFENHPPFTVQSVLPEGKIEYTDPRNEHNDLDVVRIIINNSFFGAGLERLSATDIESLPKYCTRLGIAIPTTREEAKEVSQEILNRMDELYSKINPAPR